MEIVWYVKKKLHDTIYSSVRFEVINLQYYASAEPETWLLSLVESGGLHLFPLSAGALSVFCIKPDQGGTCNVIRDIRGLTRHSEGPLYYISKQTRTCFASYYFQYFKGLSRIVYYWIKLNGLIISSPRGVVKKIVLSNSFSKLQTSEDRWIIVTEKKAKYDKYLYVALIGILQW